MGLTTKLRNAQIRQRVVNEEKLTIKQIHVTAAALSVLIVTWLAWIVIVVSSIRAVLYM